jgi:hypothetical protein
MMFGGIYTEDWASDAERENRFVFIGKHLDREELTKGFMACVVDKPLRFAVGVEVDALDTRTHGEPVWRRGVITAQWEDVFPYLVAADGGEQVLVEEDNDEFVKLVPQGGGKATGNAKGKGKGKGK